MKTTIIVLILLFFYNFSFSQSNENTKKITNPLMNYQPNIRSVAPDSSDLPSIKKVIITNVSTYNLGNDHESNIVQTFDAVELNKFLDDNYKIVGYEIVAQIGVGKGDLNQKSFTIVWFLKK